MEQSGCELGYYGVSQLLDLKYQSKVTKHYKLAMECSSIRHNKFLLLMATMRQNIIPE